MKIDPLPMNMSNTLVIFAREVEVGGEEEICLFGEARFGSWIYQESFVGGVQQDFRSVLFVEAI